MGAEGKHLSNLAGSYSFYVRLLGANGANPTEEMGSNHVAITRTGEGAYLATWDEYPGEFLGWRVGFGAATPADLAGYTAVRDTFDTSTNSVAFVIYNSSFAAADLIANQYADIEFLFADNTTN